MQNHKISLTAHPSTPALPAPPNVAPFTYVVYNNDGSENVAFKSKNLHGVVVYGTCNTP